MDIETRIDEDPAGRDAAAGGVGTSLHAHLARCIARLELSSAQPDWVVHEVRKDLKRVRALLRLGREVLPTLALERQCAAVARALSPLRDAAAVDETIERLRPRADARQREALEGLAEWLASREDAEPQGRGLPRKVAGEIAGELRRVAAGVQALRFESMDSAAIDAALAGSWDDTAMAFARVLDDPRLPRYHDFRKAVKRELYQRELSGRPLDRMECATLQKLADVLGELQDLDVFRAMLRDAGRWRPPVRGLVKKTLRELKARALRLGRGRYQEPES